MAGQTDVFAGLEPLFAAERERRLDSMESTVHALADAQTPTDRIRAITILARDAHSLKGAAQMEARQELCDLTDALERRLDDLAAQQAGSAAVDLLLRTVSTLRLLSRGTPAGATVARTMAELEDLSS